MFAGIVQITRGDVVACGASVYFVRVMDGDGMMLLRIEGQGNVRHRADVVPEHWSDIAVSGLPVQGIVVRCVPIRRYGTCNLSRMGSFSDILQGRIEIALKQEMLVRRFEDSPPMRSNLVASTSSRGRRVGAVRYA